jgi:hypothetical protein
MNVDGEAAVDEALRVAAAAGARVTRRAAATDWGGYVAYFTDPDGHLWEVAHNPGFPLGPDGRVSLPPLSRRVRRTSRAARAWAPRAAPASG